MFLYCCYTYVIYIYRERERGAETERGAELSSTDGPAGMPAGPSWGPSLAPGPARARPPFSRPCGARI